MKMILAASLAALAPVFAPSAHADTLDEAFTAEAERVTGIEIVDENAAKLGEYVCRGIAVGFDREVIASILETAEVDDSDRPSRKQW